ncbi:MAG: M42 family peptidase [Thermoprotei archaeon]|nr:MAG: M42 family peptidase [Thermoprotei archaeon]
MREKLKEILRRLCLSPGVSGFEDEVRKEILNIAKDLNVKAEVNVDNLGNLILTIGSAGPSVAIMAHMDEIGIVVRYIDDNGFLGIDAVGGIDVRTIIGKSVMIYGRETTVHGVICVKPIHLLSEDERKKIPDIRSLFVDIGASNKDEASKLVRIGDVGHIVKTFRELTANKEDIISCGALDDRAGCAALLMAASLIREKDLECKLHLVFTVQEEVGARGSRVAAYNLKPDVAIAVDVTHAVGYPDLQPKDFTDVQLGKGTVIEYGPPINWRLARFLMDLAEEKKIRYQASYLRGRTGTDIDEAQIARSGAIASVISIPLRYMHTPVETVSLSDLEATVNLIVEFVRRFNEEVYKELKPR